MNEILIFNDPHLADKSPRGRKPGYTDEGLAMVSEVIDLANERQADAQHGELAPLTAREIEERYSRFGTHTHCS